MLDICSVKSICLTNMDTTTQHAVDTNWYQDGLTPLYSFLG